MNRISKIILCAFILIAGPGQFTFGRLPARAQQTGTAAQKAGATRIEEFISAADSNKKNSHSEKTNPSEDKAVMHIVSSHEIGFGISAGTSAMIFKSMNARLKEKPGYNTAVNIQYGYNFNKNWALIFAAEASYVQTVATSEAIQQTTGNTFDFYRPVTLHFTSEIENFQETNQMIAIQGTLMARYRYEPATLKWGYYFAFGIKAGGSVWNQYTAHASALKQTGDFYAFGQQFQNMPEHNFISKENINHHGQQVISGTNFAPAIETGTSYRFNNRHNLYFGVFCNYALNTAIGQKELNGQAAFVTFDPEQNDSYIYYGLFNKSAAKYSAISRLQAGVKVCLVFGLSDLGYFRQKTRRGE